MRKSTFTLALVAIAACGKGQSAGAPAGALPSADGELAHDFSDVSSVVELADHRVLVVDEDDGSLALADFAANSVKNLGRKGDGPAEYRMLDRAFLLGPDSVLVDDLMHARFLVFTAGALSPQPVAVDVRAINTVPVAVDRTGRIYSQSPTFNRDSVPVMRFDPKTRHIDTVTFAQTDESRALRPAAGEGTQSMSVCVLPHVRGDLWSVFPDGTVIIARGLDYHVEAISPDGRRTVGPIVAVPRVAVPPAERSGPCADRAQYLQPFYGGPSTSHRISPDGLFWVRRSTRNDGDPERYDLFNVSAVMVDQVALPAATRLVGFGAGAFYAVHIDDNGLQRLRRFARSQTNAASAIKRP